MYGLKLVTGFITVSTAWLLLTACTVLRPSDGVRAQIREPGIARTGKVVQLYYGGKEVKKQFCPGDAVTVYRYPKLSTGPLYRSKYEVGTVKITKNVSGRFVEGLVVDGQVMAGDVAMKSDSTCYVKMSQR